MEKKEIKQVEQNKVTTLKEQLMLMAEQNVNGIDISPSSKLMVARNYAKLMEMKNKNSSLFTDIANSANRNATFLTVINNSSAGLELGTDFHLVKFNNSIAEIKTGFGWKLLAEKFSVDPIHFIKTIIVTKHDKFSFKWDEENECQVLANYEKDWENKVIYDDIMFVYGVVKFKNGVKRTRILTKQEIDKMRDVSPARNKNTGELSPSSPWAKWPLQMVEGKAYRDLVKREIVMDSQKMATLGYKMVDDETPIQVIKDESGFVVTNDNSVYDNNSKDAIKETVVEVEEVSERDLNLSLIAKELENDKENVLKEIREFCADKKVQSVADLNDDDVKTLSEKLIKKEEK